LRRYKAKRIKTRCYQERVGHLQPRFQGEGVVPGEYVFGFYKTRHILLSDGQTAPYDVCRRFDTIPACVTQTDRRTDGKAIASTALAMRAFRRAVKNE